MTKRSIASLVSALICLALLNGCSSNKQKPQEITEPTEESVRFEISAFSDTPSSEQEDWAAALSAFKISCRSIYRKTAWAEACSKASGTDAQNAEAFFKNTLPNHASAPGHAERCKQLGLQIRRKTGIRQSFDIHRTRAGV